MSAPAPVKAPWIKQHYEKAVLIGVLLLLLISTIFLVSMIGRGRDQIIAAGQVLETSHGAKAAAFDGAALAAAAKQLDTPFQFGALTNRLLASEVRVYCETCGKGIPFAAEVCPFCTAPQPPLAEEAKIDSDSDGMPDDWEQAHGLNPFSPDDALVDKDGDGFSNLEEFQSGTNPNEKADSPSIAQKLRIYTVKVEPFKMKFVAIQEPTPGDLVFQLNLRSMQRTYFARLGDTIPEEKVVLISFHSTNQVLTIRRDEREIGLELGKAINKDEITVIFASLLDMSTLSAKVGETFKLRDQTFLLKSVAPNYATALIVDTQTNREMTIARFSEADRLEIERRRNPAAAAGGGLLPPPERPPVAPR